MIKISLNKSDILIIEEIIDKINNYDDSDAGSYLISENLLEENNLLLMETLLKLKKGNLKKILSEGNLNKKKRIKQRKLNLIYRKY